MLKIRLQAACLMIPKSKWLYILNTRCVIWFLMGKIWGILVCNWTGCCGISECISCSDLYWISYSSLKRACYVWFDFDGAFVGGLCVYRLGIFWSDRFNWGEEKAASCSVKKKKKRLVSTLVCHHAVDITHIGAQWFGFTTLSTAV